MTVYMENKVTKEIAEEYLRDIDPPWKAFWFHMHSVAKNLREFAEGLDGISDEVFEYHVEGQKNDLAKWVHEVVGDSVLARALEEVADQHEAARIVSERVEVLEKSRRQ